MNFKISLIISAGLHFLIFLVLLHRDNKLNEPVFQFEDNAVVISASLSSNAISNEIDKNEILKSSTSKNNTALNKFEKESQEQTASYFKAQINSLSVNKPPSYPIFCSKNNIEGDVVLVVEIKNNGTIGVISVESCSGSNLFASAAIEAALKWKLTENEISAEYPIFIRQKILFRIQD